MISIINRKKLLSLLKSRSLFFIVIAIGLSSCLSHKKVVKSPKTSFEQEEIIQYSKQFSGTPYRYAGTSPNGFDCSGFTQFVYSHFGYQLPRTTKAQAQKYPTIKRKNLQKGDLVFFSGKRINQSVGHVGIITEILPNKHFNFIHSSTSKGVVISTSTNRYFSKRYLKSSRVLSSQSQKLSNKLSENQFIYTVKKGNTLYSIAKRYNCSVNDILKWNKLSDTTLFIGQKLTIKKR